jgi:hypothetical protein
LSMAGFAHAPALIAAVFLNGVNIEGVRSQTFEKCRTVRLDEKGDVHLDCPGYQVETPAAPAAPAARAPAPPAVPVAAAAVAPLQLSKHYFLVTEQGAGGDPRYDVDVFINSKWVRKLKNGEDQIVMDISKLLQPGPNKLLFAATKRAAPGLSAPQPTAYLKIIVGEGEQGGGNVLIDNPLVECKRTAAEVDNINEEFTVQAR